MHTLFSFQNSVFIILGISQKLQRLKEVMKIAGDLPALPCYTPGHARQRQSLLSASGHPCEVEMEALGSSDLSGSLGLAGPASTTGWGGQSLVAQGAQSSQLTLSGPHAPDPAHVVATQPVHLLPTQATQAVSSARYSGPFGEMNGRLLRMKRQQCRQGHPPLSAGGETERRQAIHRPSDQPAVS